MAKYDKKTASLRLSDKQTDPEAKIEIRPLAEDELQRLERALGKSVDRQYLAYWVSEAIRDVVKLSMLPTARQLRTDLTRMARDGRQWLRHVDEYYDTFSPRQRAELDQLRTAADAFLESVDFMAAQVAASIKAGRPARISGCLHSSTGWSASRSGRRSCPVRRCGLYRPRSPHLRFFSSLTRHWRYREM